MTTPTPLTESTLDRLTALRRQRQAIDDEIGRILGKRPDGSKPLWGPCRRCGYVWEGNWPNRIPRACARCHSHGWMEDPRPGTLSRRPSDPPHPKWYRRKRPSKVEVAASLPVGLRPPPPPADVPRYMRPRVEPQPEVVVTRSVTVTHEEVMPNGPNPTTIREVTGEHLAVDETSAAQPEPAKEESDGGES